ncbi:thymidine kinase [Paenibacillus thailandensis]|uniref:Thymidine kinase n=1 Tax=Paenibacillus thailandensis TaxID=393250 RepID=A0ABW5R3Q5_9BACL
MEKGIITVITGPMFSEKSGELIKRCRKLRDFGRKKVIAFKPAEDTRFVQNEIVSRSGYGMEAVCVPRRLPKEWTDAILAQSADADVVAFDEAQFFAEPIVGLVEELACRGKMIICDGLNLDYRGKPFGCMGSLLAMADEIVKLTAYCAVCGDPHAAYTQRIVGGQPALPGPIVLIGDTESYEPRCRRCFVPPHKAAEAREASTLR